VSVLSLHVESTDYDTVGSRKYAHGRWT